MPAKSKLNLSELVEQHKNGKSLKELSKEFKTSKSNISRQLKKLRPKKLLTLDYLELSRKYLFIADQEIDKQLIKDAEWHLKLVLKYLKMWKKK